MSTNTNSTVAPFNYTLAAIEIVVGDQLFNGSTYHTVTAVAHINGRSRITVDDDLTFQLGGLEPLVALFTPEA